MNLKTRNSLYQRHILKNGAKNKCFLFQNIFIFYMFSLCKTVNDKFCTFQYDYKIPNPKWRNKKQGGM